eukprot:444218_1
MDSNKDRKHLLPMSVSTPKNGKTRRRCIIYSVLITIAFLVLLAITISFTYMYLEEDSSIIGLYGKFPCHAGNIQNQQVGLNSIINKHNLHKLHTQCIYNGSTSDEEIGGYLVVDNQNNAYFSPRSDTSASSIRSVNLDNCTERWNIRLNDLLEPLNYNVLGTPILYKLNNGKQGLLFSVTPLFTYDDIDDWRCYAVSIDINDGSLLWKTILATGNTASYCRSWGFMIKNEFAYGGVSSFLNGLAPSSKNLFSGRVNKININTGKIVQQWQTIASRYFDENINFSEEGFYSGAGVWPLNVAIIDNYVVFGTGNLYTIPNRVQQCLLGNTTAIPEENIMNYNMCNEDMRDIYVHWKCLEKDVYTDSVVVLSLNSMTLQHAVPFAGVDAFQSYCVNLWVNDFNLWTNASFCPIRNWTYAMNTNAMDFAALGPDIDVNNIATYHDTNGNAFAAISQKSGQFYVMELETGEIKISKKVGAWSTLGGGTPWNLGVDEENMIAIYSIIGNSADYWPEMNMYPWDVLADGTIVCNAGTVHAIDVNTGYTIWSWIHPYGKINSECNNTFYDNYVDITIKGTCEFSFDGTEMLLPNETVINVVIPPLDENVNIPMDIDKRGSLIAPVTINNGMVFIPTNTGDIFVHNILNGEYITRFGCPDYKINETHWNRAGIRGGVTVYEDRIIFYCGSTKESAYAFGNQLISMKI